MSLPLYWRVQPSRWAPHQRRRTGGITVTIDCSLDMHLAWLGTRYRRLVSGRIVKRQDTTIAQPALTAVTDEQCACGRGPPIPPCKPPLRFCAPWPTPRLVCPLTARRQRSRPQFHVPRVIDPKRHRVRPVVKMPAATKKASDHFEIEARPARFRVWVRGVAPMRRSAQCRQWH
jgi:hypothetical protein